MLFYMYFWLKVIFCLPPCILQFLQGIHTTHVTLFTLQSSQSGFQQYLTDIRETMLSGCWTTGSHDSNYALQQMLV